ncbi:hypothetical protein SAMN05216490_0649 [Mucilaginibacter mallensis]|uniref:Uncharacterized protein n=1 Tax=Mucilaginibacter mallensis TaxID=652787 RepID=A0A1H1PYW9_MUCMA|nr:hypothetical protein [Mucilaginibacter mallensis]SDS16177.1 hypothetical protein SAMN05216490_0649 [Mucilaginibacter mallensis]
MRYYVNKRAQSNGDHEVHTENCIYLPNETDRQYLGDYSSCKPAVDKAKETYPSADGCKTCSRPCHTR